MEIKKKLLTFCNEAVFVELLRDVLVDYDIKPISNVSIITNIQTAERCLREDKFEVLMLTNLGIPPLYIKNILRILPPQSSRNFRIYVLSGYIDDELKNLCREKEVSLNRLPIPIAKLRSLID